MKYFKTVRSNIDKSKIQPIALFSCSTVAAILVNKHVLWQLKFTYPTIFQSIQMACCSLCIISANVLGYVEISRLKPLIFVKWLPAVLFFTISIYTGSKSLAILPIPVFALTQQNLTYGFLQIFLIYKQRKLPKTIALSFLILCSIFVLIVLVIGDHVYQYGWMLLHCTSNGCYSYFVLYIYHSEMKEMDKMVLNSSCSIILLILFGVITGEVQSVLQFQYIWNYSFHFACLCSGTFGTIIIVSYGNLCQVFSIFAVRFINSLVMLFVSVLSLFIYEIFYFNNFSVSTFMGLFAIVIYCYFIQRYVDDIEVSNEEENESSRFWYQT